MSSDGDIDSDDGLLGHVVADRYFVEDRLGEGGMGTVYTARHVTLDKRVALKVLHGEFSRKPDLVERFLQEAKAASSIRNEHVIDITDFGVTGEGYVFFTMEHLQGKDLHTLLGEFTAEGELLPWERSKNIFLQVCEALAAAHRQGIIHRDLKPENIFLVEGTGRADYVKLLDFGIAKVEGSSADGERKLTKTGMLFGTPEYMAPEQARGEKPDHRVDVYAMGCLLFQFLVGTVPFKADSFMAILTQHMVEPVPAIGSELLARSGAPAGIIAAVNKSLAKNREERFADIESLAAAVREAEEGVAQASTVPAPAAKKRKGPRSTDWTGSIRGIDTLVEEEVEQEQQIARRDAAPANKKVLYGVIAAVALGVGGFALSKVLGGGDTKPTPAVVEQPTTEVLPVAEAEPEKADGQEAVPAGGADTPASPDVKPETVTGAAPELTAAKEGESPIAPEETATAKPKTKPRGSKHGSKPKGGSTVSKQDPPKGDTASKESGKAKTGKDTKKDDTPAIGDVTTKDPFQ